MLDFDFGVLFSDFGSKIQPPTKTCEPRTKIQNPNSKITKSQNPNSKIESPKSKLKNPDQEELEVVKLCFHFRVVAFKKKNTCTRAPLEIDSRGVPGYPKFTLCSLKWVHEVNTEFEGGSQIKNPDSKIKTLKSKRTIQSQKIETPNSRLQKCWVCGTRTVVNCSLFWLEMSAMTPDRPDDSPNCESWRPLQ